MESGKIRQFIVGIGVSESGLEALREFIINLPAELTSNVSMIIVSSVSLPSSKLIHHLLNQEVVLQLKEAKNGLQVKKGTIYITPPGKDISIKEGNLVLRKSLSDKRTKSPLGILFQSLAEQAKEKAIGIILGMPARSITADIKAIKKSGGYIIVQDVPIWAMKEDADVRLTPCQMGKQMLDHTRYPEKKERKRKYSNMIGPIANEYLKKVIEELERKNADLQSANKELKRKEKIFLLKEKERSSQNRYKPNIDQFRVGTSGMIVEDDIKQTLLQSDKKYLFYSNPMPLWIFDYQTKRFLEVNDAAVKHYGYSREEFLTMMVRDIRPQEDKKLFEKLKKVVEDGPLMHHGLWRHLKKNGELIHVEITSYHINYGDGRAVMVLSNDVTERLETEIALKNSELRFRSLIEKSSEIIALHDSQGKILYMSPSTLTTLGYPPEERIGKFAFDAIHPDDASRIKKILSDLLANPGNVANAQWRHQHADGTWRWMEGVATNLLNDPAVNAVVHNFRDITAQKEAENATRDSEEKRKLILNAALDAIICIDTKGNITFWNPQAEKIFGWKEEEITGRVLSQIIFPEPNRQILDKSIEDYLQIGETKALNVLLELNAINREGKNFPIELTILPIKQGGEEFFCAFIRDITKRKTIEDAIHFSKERYDIVVKATNDSIWDWDLVNNLVFRNNRKIETLFGYEGWDGDEVDHFWSKLVHPADWAKMSKKREAIFKDPQANYWEDEYRFLKTNGEYAYIYDRAYILRNEQGEAVRMIGASQDISERKEAEEKIKAERNLLRTLIDNMPDAIYVKDAQGRKLLSNKVDLEIMGAESESEVIGKTDLELYPIAIGSPRYEVDMDVIRTGKSYVKREEQFITQKGKEVWVLTTKVPLRNEKGEITGLVGIGTDIINLKKIEAELVFSEEKYRLLFYLSPLPILIFDIETNQIVDANNSAIHQYGYDHAGFVNITLYDIQPNVNMPKMILLAKEKSQDKGILQFGIWDHIKKNGQKIKVEMTAHSFQYNQRNCMMVVCSDITEKLAFQQALVESNERFEYATKATFDAIWDWDIINDIIYWGEGFENLFGHKIEDLKPTSHSWSELIHPHDCQNVLNGIYNAINTNKKNWTSEYRYRKANGEYAFVHDKGIIVRDENGKGMRMIGAMHDITARKQGEEHLKLLESVITHTTDSILITEAEPIDDQGPRIIYVNDSFTKMTGYSSEEVMGKTPRILQGPKTDRKELDSLRKALQTRKPCKIEIVNYKKNGEEFWISMSIVPVADAKGWVTHWVSVERDITERKMAEVELKEKNSELKKLSAYLQNVREEERKYIAREVHDELGQLASALKIDIDWLSIKIVALEDNVKNRITHANKTIEILINSVRKIASSLRPSVLDDFGLNAALKWHCVEFQNLNGIQCIFEPGFDDKDLSMDKKTELYRMAQESLTNVMRHAMASNVTVTTKEDADNLYLTITDNGKGFDMSQRKNTLGLIGLRERAISVSGELSIESIIGKGTIINAIVPKK